MKAINSLDRKKASMDHQEMSMSSDNFSKLASGVQSVALVFAMLVGGLWTYGTYRTLVQREKAELEVLNLKTQRDKTQLELEELKKKNTAKSNGVIDLTVVQINEQPLDGRRFIGITANIINIGNEDLNISLSQNLEAYVVKIDKIDLEGNITYSPKWKLKLDVPDRDIQSIFIAAGGDTAKLSLVQQLSTPGAYFVRLRIAFGDPNLHNALSAEKYFFVK